jgi:hypothetical protein
MKFKIERAALSDIDTFVRLSHALWIFEGNLDSNYATSKQFQKEFRKILRTNMRRRDFIILKALCDGKIVGEIIGEIQEKQPYRKLKKVDLFRHIS